MCRVVTRKTEPLPCLHDNEYPTLHGLPDRDRENVVAGKDWLYAPRAPPPPGHTHTHTAQTQCTAGISEHEQWDQRSFNI